MSWIRDHVWARGFQWGFKNFKTLVLHPNKFQFNPKIVAANYLPLPFSAINEMLDIGIDLVPYAPEDNLHGLYPMAPPLPLDSNESFDDEIVGGGARR
jgi:hypothetical protein